MDFSLVSSLLRHVHHTPKSTVHLPRRPAIHNPAKILDKSSEPQDTSDAVCINSQNLNKNFPETSDVVVVGGGIHSFIYAIHTRLRSQALEKAGTGPAISVTVLEKSQSPGYKIGESTLTTFGVWLKSIGISTSLVWRLFGPKDGLAFYWLPFNGESDGITDTCANGPAGDFVATVQIERKVSELLLTLYAQRLGVKVLHGHSVDINATKLPANDGHSSGRVEVSDGVQKRGIDTKLLVDATGRFRRFASKAARVKRLEGFNTDSFWAYFEMKGDEADIPLNEYESCHTNHICMAEGWAWIIRLPSWEGSSVPNLVAMINHLLDLNEKDTPSDAYPSTNELVKMFDLKFRWVVSIGYALRDDVVYPENLASYGAGEAERKFNWITSRYPKMQAVMERYTLIPDLYGPKTTWFIRKSLTYQSPVAAGTGWAAIGDAAGFTNPLYSPGINCNMATSVSLAERTPAYLSAKSSMERGAILKQYSDYCVERVPNLHRMNIFNYLMMRSPRTGWLGPLWQYLCGTGNEEWQRIKSFADLDHVAELITGWEWGSNRPEYIAFATKAIELLGGPPTEPAEEKIRQLLEVSDQMVQDVIRTGKFKNRWAGLFRHFDDNLKYSETKVGRDTLAKRCEDCGEWRILTGVAAKCCFCGFVNKTVAIQRYN